MSETAGKVKTAWPYANFTEKEMACKCCGKAYMDPAFMKSLQLLRDAVGFPLAVSSGYRCHEHNAKVSSTGKTGPHTTGKAADLLVSGDRAYRVMREAMQLGFTGVGVSQKGPHGGRFVHVDTIENGPGCPRPTCWSY